MQVEVIPRNPTYPYHYCYWYRHQPQRQTKLAAGVAEMLVAIHLEAVAEDLPEVEEVGQTLVRAVRAGARQEVVVEAQARHGSQPKRPNQTCPSEVAVLSREMGIRRPTFRRRGVG